MVATPLLPKIVTLTLQAEGEAGETAFDADAVECEVVSVAGDTKSITTLDGTTHQNIGPTTYNLRLVIVQDWDSTRPGLASYLWTHKGKAATFAYNAHGTSWGATVPGFSGSCTLVAPAYGGQGNEYATAELLLPIDGLPVLETTDPNA